jgi:hypothetical protein
MEETLKPRRGSIPLIFRKLVHIDCCSEYTIHHKQPGNTNLTIRNCVQISSPNKKDPPLRLCVCGGIQTGGLFGIPWLAVNLLQVLYYDWQSLLVDADKLLSLDD